MTDGCIEQVDVTLTTYVVDVTVTPYIVQADVVAVPVISVIDVGVAGPQGPPGPVGPTGPQGPPGPSGSSVVGIEFVIDGGGAAVSSGVKGDLDIPFACTLNEAVLLADQAGNAVVDVWRSSYPAFPPTAGNSITGGTPPTLSSSLKYDDISLSGWSTLINAGDILRYNVNSASTVQRLTLSLKATRQ